MQNLRNQKTDLGFTSALSILPNTWPTEVNYRSSWKTSHPFLSIFKKKKKKITPSLNITLWAFLQLCIKTNSQPTKSLLLLSLTFTRFFWAKKYSLGVLIILPTVNPSHSQVLHLDYNALDHITLVPCRTAFTELCFSIMLLVSTGRSI